VVPNALAIRKLSCESYNMSSLPEQPATRAGLW